MYLVNGGRVVKGSARETEVVPSRPSSSSESGNSSGSSTTSNSVPAATQTTTSSSQTNSSSQQNNTESQPQTSSAPTCTAAQMAAAQGAAMNAYFAEQDKKREENNKQNNNSGSSSSSSSSQSSETQHNTNDQYIMAQKDYDEHYGNYTSETATDNSTTYTNSVTSSTSHKDEPVPGQNISGTAMEDLLMWGDAFGKRKDALTPAEQAEMARQDAEIKKNTIDTKVWIVRNDDGLGNEFNATRYIYKNGKLVYQDVIGANAYKEDWSKENADSTTPDGVYYLSNRTVKDKANLYRQDNETVNSNTLKNVLSLRTLDKNIEERARKAVNYGDRYFHANQKLGDDTEYSVTNPWGLGCIIGQGGEQHQDEMMSVLMNGVYNPSAIQVNIVSLSNLPGFYK
ncbi:MAG: hypothetical protein K6A89_09000 [Treponema sp.]|nr:hypothetical protein [Treponema sp.]